MIRMKFSGRTRNSLLPRGEKRKAPKKSALDRGLEALRNQLGFGPNAGVETSEDHPHRGHAPLEVGDTDDHARTIFYAPDLDGQADPGEIVWFLAPIDAAAKKHSERAMLVVGRTRHRGVLGLLISPNSSHSHDGNWMEIGSGQWDSLGRPCWIRLDRVLEVPDHALRRAGALFPRARFERVASALRSRFDWN
jgi:hypothetical protein